jgi:signal transduction histidine kinase
MMKVLRRHPLLTDAALTAALAVLAIVTAFQLVIPTASVPPPPAPVVVIWAVALVAPLLLRRRFPLTVLVVTTVSFTLYWAVGQVNEIASWLTLGVAAYSAGAHGRGRRAAVVWAVCGLALAVVNTAGSLVTGLLEPFQVVGLVLFTVLPFAVGWPLGVMVRTLREYRAVLEERNRQLDAERAANTHRAILEERVRIARELHDVVAHHVSVMGVQAGVARRLFDRRPADAVEAITSVETASRQTIADLQQLVGVLRQEEPDDLAPQPRLEQLPALVAHMEQAGLPVDLAIEGAPRELPAGVELSAYRIVQEALTNALKHAGPARAGVTVRYHDHAVEVEVLDDGRGPSPTRAGTGGKGLLGMRERVGVHGGRLDTGRGPRGGFRVHAVLTA